MSISHHEDEQPSGHHYDQHIGPLQPLALIWNTGAPETRGVAENKIRLMRNTYKYKPIAYHEDIRILKILHGKDDSALECMLFRSSLQSTTSTSKSDYYEYYALSYVWGEDQPIHPVTIYDDRVIRDGLQTVNPFSLSGKL
jgi:hypothetical protein